MQISRTSLGAKILNKQICGSYLSIQWQLGLMAGGATLDLVHLFLKRGGGSSLEPDVEGSWIRHFSKRSRRDSGDGLVKQQLEHLS